MNEKIIELAKEAGIHPANFEPDADLSGPLKKLAELIVLEMCNVLDKAQWDKGEDWVCADGTRIILQIKEHFGVEE